MNLELAGIALIKQVIDPDTGAATILNSVSEINFTERRRIAEQKIPGLKGNILNDFGRNNIRISLKGLVSGEDALEFLKSIRSKYKAREPVTFSSDISRVVEVTQVLIESFQLSEIGGTKNTWNYWLVLREYLSPAEEEEKAAGKEEEAEEEVDEQAEEDEGSVNYITGKVVDTDDKPVTRVDVKITFDGGEYTVKTDEEGIFRKDDLEPRKYTVTIDAEGFEEVEKEVIVKSGKEEIEVKEKEAEEEEIEKEEPEKEIELWDEDETFENEEANAEEE